jgi:hypothetical protein
MLLLIVGKFNLWGLSLKSRIWRKYLLHFVYVSEGIPRGHKQVSTVYERYSFFQTLDTKYVATRRPMPAMSV